jgi:RNA polymerase sigma-70 factor (ECF subfamily)
MARGDETAFHEFYAAYFNRLLRYLLVVSRGNEEVSRDALQLAFVRVARHVRRFESEPAFWSWLTVLARSSIVDETRKRSRYQALLARFIEHTPEAADSHSSADQRFLELVREELAALPAEERELMERKYFGREPIRTLADERDLTEKAMESRLLRIRRKLKTAVLDRMRNETTDSTIAG